VESSLDEFAAGLTRERNIRRTGQPVETPWRPGYEVDGTAGEIVTGAVDGDVDWDSIFRHWNLDPALWEVVEGTLRVNAWEGPSTGGGQTIYRQYKASIVRRVAASVDVDPIVRRIAGRRPKRPAASDGTATFVSSWADWQVGGMPPEAWEAQFTASLDGVVARAKVAAKAGADRALVGFVGDMVEGLWNYSNQHFSITLDLRSQKRVVRAAEAAVVAAIAPLFPNGTTVVAVPGNHGRVAPKVVTRASDNADMECFEVVASEMTATGFAEEYGVKFVHNPESVITLTDASGTRVLWVHGDQVKGSADAIKKWYSQVLLTNWQNADANIVVTGHRHHLRIEELAGGEEPRWLFQSPCLADQSDWFAELGGGTSQPGTLSFTTADGRWWGLDVT
jgi:UDP-2,3-diacylglucosamine pyrophosphatase LpxH